MFYVAGVAKRRVVRAGAQKARREPNVVDIKEQNFALARARDEGDRVVVKFKQPAAIAPLIPKLRRRSKALKSRLHRVRDRRLKKFHLNQGRPKCRKKYKGHHRNDEYYDEGVVVFDAKSICARGSCAAAAKGGFVVFGSKSRHKAPFLSGL